MVNCMSGVDCLWTFVLLVFLTAPLQITLKCHSFLNEVFLYSLSGRFYPFENLLLAFLGEKATSQHQRLAKYQRRSASCFFIEWSKVHLVLLHLVSFFAGVHHLRAQIKERVLCVVIWVKSNDFFFFLNYSLSHLLPNDLVQRNVHAFGCDSLCKQHWNDSACSSTTGLANFFNFRLESVLWICP